LVDPLGPVVQESYSNARQSSHVDSRKVRPMMVTEFKTRPIEPDITVVELTGQLHAGSTLLAVENSLNKILKEGPKKIVVDLSGLHLIDSSGIGILVVSSAQVRKLGGSFRLAGAVGSVANVLEMIGLNQVIPMDPDVETAARHLAESQAAQ
jgi:anti-anti-sigma factor